MQQNLELWAQWCKVMASLSEYEVKESSNIGM